MAGGGDADVRAGVGALADMVLGSNPLNPSTETRAGPNHTLVYTFNKPVTAGIATATEGVATVGGVTFSGNEMRVPLSGVTDVQYVTVGVSGVVAEVCIANGEPVQYGDVLFRIRPA